MKTYVVRVVKATEYAFLADSVDLATQAATEAMLGVPNLERRAPAALRALKKELVSVEVLQEVPIP